MTISKLIYLLSDVSQVSVSNITVLRENKIMLKIKYIVTSGKKCKSYAWKYTNNQKKSRNNLISNQKKCNRTKNINCTFILIDC
jgi:hypothetical protein